MQRDMNIVPLVTASRLTTNALTDECPPENVHHQTREPSYYRILLVEAMVRPPVCCFTTLCLGTACFCRWYRHVLNHARRHRRHAWIDWIEMSTIEAVCYRIPTPAFSLRCLLVLEYNTQVLHATAWMLSRCHAVIFECMLGRLKRRRRHAFQRHMVYEAPRQKYRAALVEGAAVERIGRGHSFFPRDFQV